MCGSLVPSSGVPFVVFARWATAEGLHCLSRRRYHSHRRRYRSHHHRRRYRSYIVVSATTPAAAQTATFAANTASCRLCLVMSNPNVKSPSQDSTVSSLFVTMIEKLQNEIVQILLEKTLTAAKKETIKEKLNSIVDKTRGLAFKHEEDSRKLIDTIDDRIEQKLNNHLEKISDIVSTQMHDQRKTYANVTSIPLKVRENVSEPLPGRQQFGRQAVEIVSKDASFNPNQVLSQLKAKVTSKKLSDRKIQITGKKITKKGVIINCSSEVEAQAVKDLLTEETDFDVRIATRYPWVKISGIPIDVQEKEIRSTILQCNPALNEAVSKKENAFVHKYTGKPRFGKRNALFETSPEVLQEFVNRSNGRVAVGFELCRVQEHHQVRQCHKCNRFGHIAIQCPNERACGKCAKNHEGECPTEASPKCVNCVIHNEKDKDKLSQRDVNHFSFNIKSCPSFQGMIARVQSSIDYGL